MSKFFGKVIIAVVMVGGLLSAKEQNMMNRSFNEMEEIENSETARHFGARLGLAPFYQRIGIGWRLPTLSGQGANDFALSCNFVLWGLPEDVIIVPTLEYAYIAYRSNSANLNATKYIGYGLDLFVNYSLSSFPLIPNPKISWGKEFDDGHFSEWSVNIVPVATFAMVFFDSYQDDWSHVLGALALSTAIEYRYGF